MAPFAALIVALVIVALLFSVVYIASRNTRQDEQNLRDDLKK